MLNKLVLVVCALAAAPCFVSALYEVTVQKTATGYLIQPKDTNTNTPLSPRLIGGEEVTPHQYPFQAALLIFKGDNIYFCGGTLLTNQWVLTTARCLDMKPNSITVVLGAHDLQNLEVDIVQAYNTSKYKHHSDFNKVTFENDVGLVRLPSDATLDKNVNVVELAKGTDEYVGKDAITLGWGKTETEELSTVLKRETSSIISNDDCVKSDDNYKDVIKSTNICTSGKGPKGICNGDNGGPLLVDGVQVGIASFGTADCTLTLPSVFVREADFHAWIDDNLVDEGFDDPGDDDDGDDDDDDNDDGGASTHSLLFVAIASTAMCLVRLFGMM